MSQIVTVLSMLAVAIQLMSSRFQSNEVIGPQNSLEFYKSSEATS